MRQDKTTLERVFELAKSGQCATINQLRLQLKVENYDQHLIQGPSLLTQLRAIMDAAQTANLRPAEDP
jgi:hypothetical protein